MNDHYWNLKFRNVFFFLEILCSLIPPYVRRLAQKEKVNNFYFISNQWNLSEY